MFRLLFRWLPKSALTRLTGWLACRRRPRLMISGGIRLYRWHFRIDMGDFAEPEGGFVTFNEFFARPLKPGRRPVDAAADGIVSPVDGGIGMAGIAAAADFTHDLMPERLGPEVMAQIAEAGFYCTPSDWFK